jgi:hypothetical protein
LVLSKQAKIFVALLVGYLTTWLAPGDIVPPGAWLFSMYMAIWGLESSLKERAGLDP